MLAITNKAMTQHCFFWKALVAAAVRLVVAPSSIKRADVEAGSYWRRVEQMSPHPCDA
jgi:hypothetical protein